MKIEIVVDVFLILLSASGIINYIVTAYNYNGADAGWLFSSTVIGVACFVYLHNKLTKIRKIGVRGWLGGT